MAMGSFTFLLLTAFFQTTVSLPVSSSVLLPNSILKPGESLASPDNNTFFTMEPSGQLSVCVGSQGCDGTCRGQSSRLWTTAISPSVVVPGSFAIMEEYGVLAVWRPATPGKNANMSTDRLWWTQTMSTAGCIFTSQNCSHVQAQNDGNVVMYKGARPGSNPTQVLWSTQTHTMPTNAKNVLHIIVDDLRPQMNLAYHQTGMITPAFDRLAREGLVFDRAYCSIAVCAPSRNSFMSGLRPEVTGIFNFGNHIREPGQPHIVTIPQAFKNAGYITLGGGKTFHYNLPPYFDDVIQGSWSSDVQLYFPFIEFTGSKDMAYCAVNGTVGTSGPSASMCVVEGDEYAQIYDYRLRNHTIDTLRLVSTMQTPFYVMAGFRRPHRVFKVMKKYWDLYPETLGPVAVYKVRDASTQPLIAFHPAGFLLPNGSNYQGTPDEAWPDHTAQIARRAYSVAVTQTDSYIGDVLNELDTLGLATNTVVICHSDHGWQLGEHGLWDKQTEFELATRVPLIIRAPWMTNSVGKHTKAFAELVDLHPTILSLAGIPFVAPTALPAAVAIQGTGQDLSPLFINPDALVAQPGKNASFSQWPVCTDNASVMCMACTGPQSSRAVIKAMGYSIRVDEWRLTTWIPFNTTLYIADWGALPIAMELYDHRNASVVFDFDNDGEAVNVAGRAEYTGIEKQLFIRLQQQYDWPIDWLVSSRMAMRRGQLAQDERDGFYPYSYDGVVPSLPSLL
eukprot:m.235426 g.235426  ORF g.235426 m.235426 type:complete len:731 (+) comp33664_c2_seq1:100-2292(+)